MANVTFYRGSSSGLPEEDGSIIFHTGGHGLLLRTATGNVQIADRVTCEKSATAGVKIGTITINNTDTNLYSGVQSVYATSYSLINAWIGDAGSPQIYMVTATYTESSNSKVRYYSTSVVAAYGTYTTTSGSRTNLIGSATRVHSSSGWTLACPMITWAYVSGTTQTPSISWVGTGTSAVESSKFTSKMWKLKG